MPRRNARTPRGPRWYECGEEPDYRFSLANERTFLAWMRTALALLAAAVAVAELLPQLGEEKLRQTLGVLLAGLGVLCSASAYPRWAANQRAMRTGSPLPRNSLLTFASVVFVLIGLGVLALVLSG